MSGLSYFDPTMKLRTRITIAMLTLVIISLVTIGGVTIWFFKEQNEEYHRERLERKEGAIRKEMEYYSSEMEMQDDMDVIFLEFEQQILRMSDVHDLEINIFNTRGALMISSEWEKEDSDYYRKEVPPEALKALGKTDRIVIPEVEDNRLYLSDYTLLKNRAGDVIAIMNLPYIRNRDLNRQDLEEFLGSLALVYVFIFLGAIGIIVLLSRSITSSLAILGGKMRTVAFTGKNEPLNWNTHDEIGMLVDSYNTMLGKLEESREALAQNERESAWREMAKQVAHEIKNPLTPMKLSIQHLQATSGNKDDAWKEKFDRTMAMMIEQIESLSRIASEFSDFAKMPKAQVGDVNVAEVFQSMDALYSEAHFKWHVDLPEPGTKVTMDKDRLTRVLTNLIKNAKQAMKNQPDASIALSYELSDKHITLSVKDNGPGMEAELQHKVFQPNFTTKTSGTGLGLAICKQILEEAGGSIWFKSTLGIGTEFFVRLPLSETA